MIQSFKPHFRIIKIVSFLELEIVDGDLSKNIAVSSDMQEYLASYRRILKHVMLLPVKHEKRD